MYANTVLGEEESVLIREVSLFPYSGVPLDSKDMHIYVQTCTQTLEATKYSTQHDSLEEDF